MKILILFLIFLMSSCSTLMPVDIFNKNPRYQDAFRSFLNRCQNDVANGKLLINFEKPYQNFEFCVCLHSEFTTTFNGEKLTSKNYNRWIEEFRERPDEWMIHDFETEKEKYFDMYSSIQNQNKHPSWKQRYINLYESDVKKCILNSKYAQDRWSGKNGLSKN